MAPDLVLISLSCRFFLVLFFPPLVMSQPQMYGSLQSPNFPDPYPRETELHWNVSVPEGFRIRLYFSHFDLEPSYLCEYDSVKVRPQRILGNPSGIKFK